MKDTNHIIISIDYGFDKIQHRNFLQGGYRRDIPSTIEQNFNFLLLC